MSRLCPVCRGVNGIHAPGCPQDEAKPLYRVDTATGEMTIVECEGCAAARARLDKLERLGLAIRKARREHMHAMARQLEGEPVDIARYRQLLTIAEEALDAALSPGDNAAGS